MVGIDHSDQLTACGNYRQLIFGQTQDNLIAYASNREACSRPNMHGFGDICREDQLTFGADKSLYAPPRWNC